MVNRVLLFTVKKRRKKGKRNKQTIINCIHSQECITSWFFCLRNLWVRTPAPIIRGGWENHKYCEAIFAFFFNSDYNYSIIIYFLHIPMKTTLSPQEHIKEYREKISAKKEELQWKRKEIFLTLQNLWTSFDPENPESVKQQDAILKAELRAYVQELKSTKEHKEQANKYHKEMKKVRDFFATIFDAENPENKDKIKKMFATSKEYFQWTDQKNRDKSQKVLEKLISNLTPQQKSKMMSRINVLMQDPKAFASEVQRIMESKPEMKTLEKIKEVASRVLNDMDLLPVVWTALFIGFLTSLSRTLWSEPMIWVDYIWMIISLRWWATAVTSTIQQWKKLVKEKNKHRVKKII